jgi:hypothetical protein
MVKMEHKTLLVTLAIILLLATPFITHESLAQSNSLALEAEQHWPTYQIGGTCCFGTNNLFVADVDNDDTAEIVTGGYMYEETNNTTTREAPLKIWSWNGSNIILEKSSQWAGYIGAIHAADADNDGIVEILTAGSMGNASGYCPVLRVWNCNEDNLVLRTSYEGVAVGSIFVGDVDGDGNPEIITAGRDYNETQYNAGLRVWHLQDDSLKLQNSAQWGATNTTVVNSVCASDLDNDGKIEVITGGYANELQNSSGQLLIWSWKEGFLVQASAEWQLVKGVFGLTSAGGVQGNTVVNNVKVADVDTDGIPEIVTGGFTYDGQKTIAQLRIWRWNAQGMALEKSQEWATKDITEVKSVAIDDVDGDGKKEIMTSGVAATYGGFGDGNDTQELAQLKVWSWDGKNLSLEQSQDWVIGDGVCAWNVASGDFDNDGTVEIVTVGCMYINNLCDPDMRIWSISTPLPSDLIIAAVAGIVILTLAGTYLIIKKHQNKS